MSKLSQLKQDAYQAGKKRDWETAVSIYERILEMDKSNPSLVNELGDLCLKTGDVRSAVRHFLNAASKYRTNGLLNNAVAIYKKVLRHEEENLNAHWYLAKTRAAQGLLTEGESHGVQFLENSTKVSGDIKEIFLKRCTQLFELYSSSTPIMEHLLQIFRMWEMSLEAARVSCILACQLWDNGDEDQARESMSNVAAQMPDIVKYPEHSQWLERINPASPSAASGYSDVNAIDFGAEASEIAEPVAEIPTQIQENKPAQQPETTGEPWGGAYLDSDNTDEIIDSVADISWDDEPGPDTNDSGNELDLEIEEPVLNIENESDDDGCFSLDIDTQVSFDELISQATAPVPEPRNEPAEDVVDPAAESIDARQESPAEDISHGGQVDLLAQILAEDSSDLAPRESDQVATITEEIGAKVGAGGNGNDGSLYEMGLVFLEMEMHDQACESFEKAACNPEYAVRAHEMWGITLLRSGKLDEAVIILTAGLDLPEEGSRQQLGMLYHLGRAQEQAERFAEAEDCYRKIHELDRSFLDVGKRLAELSTV